MVNKTGIVFDIQNFSDNDGQGLRAIVYLKGCPLKCWWCANPERQNVFPQVEYHSDKCQGCLSCINACPLNAIEVVDKPEKSVGYIKINRDKCKCINLDCVEACQNGGLTIWGTPLSVEDVIQAIKRDISNYGEKGGVTLSGGEPLYQHEFALEILKACKEENINTAIETTAFAPFEVIESFIPFVDLFLCDIKHMDDLKHKEHTGVSNKMILNNVSNLSQNTKNILIRIPLIPGCNDYVSNIQSTAKYAHDNGLYRINILPYHNIGQNKYDKLDKGYNLKDTKNPDAEILEQLRKVVEEQGVKCIIG